MSVNAFPNTRRRICKIGVVNTGHRRVFSNATQHLPDVFLEIQKWDRLIADYAHSSLPKLDTFRRAKTQRRKLTRKAQDFIINQKKGS